MKKTMKRLIWRLADRPTAMEVINLVSCAIITKEEARLILFSEDESQAGSVKNTVTG